MRRDLSVFHFPVIQPLGSGGDEELKLSTAEISGSVVWELLQGSTCPCGCCKVARTHSSCFPLAQEAGNL